MRGPYAVLSRGSISNYTTFADDTRAAYQNAIMCKYSALLHHLYNQLNAILKGYITKDQAHWNVATTILDAWGTNLTNIIGTDRSLLVGLVGPHLANAAEIMRWEGGWVEQGSKWQGGQGFSIQLYWLFARQSVILGQANYGFASIGALLNFAVYLDDVSLWNYALYAYKNDYCAGIPGIIDERTGQSSESGRDQSHVQSALGWVALAARVGKNQGIDLFKYNNNLLFKGAEYSAKYNLNQSVPYDPSYFRCEAVLVNGPWKEIANISRGVGLLGTNKTPAVWSLLHYAAVERGIKAPWTAKAKEAYDAVGGEVRSTNPDLPSWGDLLFAAKPGRN
jgi:hypothetical protein